MHLFVLCGRSVEAYSQRPGPPKSPNEDGQARDGAEGPALCKPGAIGEVGECDAGDEEEGASVGGVANVGVEAFCDEAVLGVDCKVKGEKLAECAEAVKTDVSAEEDGERANEEEGRCADGGRGGGAAKRELEAGAGLSSEQAFEEGAEPQQRHVNAEDEWRNAKEPPLLRVIPLPVHRRVGRSARQMVRRRLGKA